MVEDVPSAVGGFGEWFVDLHVHIGRTLQGRPVKMAASAAMTLPAVLEEATQRKGLDVIGIVDAACTGVLEEVQELVDSGVLRPHSGGGLIFRDRTLLLTGAEIEVAGPEGGAAHFGVWLPGLGELREFSAWLSERVTNPTLSSQRIRADAIDLQEECRRLGGLFIIHHAFTPHKGLYGNCVTHMADMVDPDEVDAVELGLSADTDMADRISELQSFAFVSDSDAHSTGRIAREYNRFRLREPSFEEIRLALHSRDGRAVTGNYGLDPSLGKYHRTACPRCGTVASDPPPVTTCPVCGNSQTVMGVLDRLTQVADLDEPRHPPGRPPYVRQVPLSFIPGLGPKRRSALLKAFGSEMGVLHRASREALAEVVGEGLADLVIRAREGRLTLRTGGGGRYGGVVV
ncbi:TIGR00375 family protein [Kyrpidia spormannii]|uniref:TIGR00375 family protein n=1 Tax=Kyrpidia spormannii TaxID=2055160 RepID=A0A2K8N741_9BACL|nr:endonuclease Q family protein [Kyrpidia spormannii]ATY85164.1 TIGR00375 family protein [Kyrpidia spormannii]